jgi:Predicted thiamine-pyrophosphate-binding protein
MLTGPEIVATLSELGVTHVIWVPDSVTGPWESALDASENLRLIRVCREGEAWPLSAGLYLGGKSPLVMMQTTGLFESGDALRNVLFDLRLPLYSLVGVRNWINSGSKDTARHFAEPILKAWGLDCAWLATPEDRSKLAEHYWRCRRANIPGAALLAEGAP